MNNKTNVADFDTVNNLIDRVLDQRININNMADRVLALEEQMDELLKITDNLMSLLEKRIWVK